MDLTTIQDFRDAVTLFTKVFKLDPELPELVRLKEPDEAQRILDAGHAHETLRLLCPQVNYFEWDNGDYRDPRYMVFCPNIGYVLQPWTIARYCIKHGYQDLVGEIVFIGADSEDVWLDDSRTPRQDVCAVAFENLFIGPLAPEENYRLVCELINNFTGLQLDYRQYLDKIQITALKDKESGAWDIVALPH